MEIEKSFGDCTLVYLEKTFGLEQIDSMLDLTKWVSISKDMVLSDFEKEELLLCQDLLSDNILHWNEQELSLHFIGPLFSLARFTNRQHRFNLFAQRTVSASIKSFSGDTIHLSGKPDGLIATGYREPELPFFCFQEYKKHKEPNGEPEGQCLSALLAGQAINQNPTQAMYGCFVMERDWYFMTLLDNKYCISQDFSAITDDIFEVFKMLKALKEIVKGLTTNS